MPGGIERKRELRRRRKRRETLAKMGKKAEKASVSEKTHMAQKLRRMTPGAEELITRWGLVTER